MTVSDLTSESPTQQVFSIYKILMLIEKASSIFCDMARSFQHPLNSLMRMLLQPNIIYFNILYRTESDLPIFKLDLMEIICF